MLQHVQYLQQTISKSCCSKSYQPAAWIKIRHCCLAVIKLLSVIVFINSTTPGHAVCTHCVNQSVAKLNFPGSPFMSASPMWLPTSYWPRSWLYTCSSSLMRCWHDASACGDLRGSA